MTAIDLRRIAELWVSGMDTAQIARLLKVPEETIYGSVLWEAIGQHCEPDKTGRVKLTIKETRK